MIRVVNKSNEEELWTKVVKKLSTKLSTKVVNKSCEQIFWAKVMKMNCGQNLCTFLTEVVNKSIAKELWTKIFYKSVQQIVYKRCIQELCTKSAK